MRCVSWGRGLLSVSNVGPASGQVVKASQCVCKKRKTLICRQFRRFPDARLDRMPSNRSALAALLSLLALGGALIMLAVLQYRWIGQLADAERQRMQSSMEFAANHFSDEFDRELTRLFVAFQGPLRDASAETSQRRFDEWVTTARDPRIVKTLWFVPSGELDQLQRLDPETHSAVPAQWPPELAAAREVIASEFAGLHRLKIVMPNEALLLVP